MSKNKKKAGTKKQKVKKTTLLTLGTGMVSWGMEQMVVGDYYSGSVGMVLGVAGLLVYVHEDELEFPLDREVLEDMSESIGDGIESRVEEDSSSEK